RQERRRRQIASDFLQHQAGLHRAETRTALRFGDEDAGEAQLGKLLPQRGAVTIGATGIAPMAQLRLDRALLGHERPDSVLQQALVVGQGHHAPGNLKICLATMPSWTSDVPPSIELALVRSQSRAALPPFDRLLSHSSASLPPAAIISSWRRLLSSVPAYFIIDGLAGCASPAFSWSMKRSLIAAKANASTSNAAISARSSGSSGFATGPSMTPDAPVPMPEPRPMPLIISRS